MIPISRREFLATGLTLAGAPAASAPQPDGPRSADVHQQILDLAARQQDRRRARFSAVSSKADVEAIQTSLREAFLR